MSLRVKALVGANVTGAAIILFLIPGHASGHWVHFFVYLAAVLLSSGMKVEMPKSDGTMSVNYPFILLGILEFSPLQAVALAAASVIAVSRFGRSFRFVQILFNVANVTTSTLLAWYSYSEALPLVRHEVAPALAIAATVYFLANTIPVALIIGWESGKAPLEQWLQEFPWFYPFYLVGAMVAAGAHFVAARYGWLTSLLLIPMVYTVYRGYRAQMSAIREHEQHIAETEALHLRTIEGLAMAIEAKDQNTHRHLMRVRVYVSEIGRIMGLDEPILRALLIAAYLHDIGKLAVPEHIINKPGKLTHEEFEKMKLHTVVGAEILERVQFPFPVVPIVRSHHEAWDGSGYPDGLKGEEIPIGARILTAVDCLDALASDRPYRRALPLPEAMAVLKDKAGSQFDPQVVHLIEEHYAALEELAHRQIEEVAPLDTNRIVERGAAPAAGFEPEHQTAQDHSQVAGDESSSRRIKALKDESRQTDQRAVELAGEMLDRIVRLNGSASASECFALISDVLQTVVPFDCFAAFLKSGNCLLPQSITGPCAAAFSSQRIPLGEGLSGWVAHCERPIINGNPTVECNFVSDAGHLTSNSSALSVPLFDQSGAVAGALTLYSRRYAAFSRDHLQILQAFSVSMQKMIPMRKADGASVGDLQPQSEIPSHQETDASRDLLKEARTP
jgi:putative nucleotidyltransferase with HDIG domain